MRLKYFTLTVVINLLIPFSLVFAGNDAQLECTTPVFEEYKANNKSFKYARNIDLGSYKGAKNFKTILTKGFKKGANFAQNIVVVSHGCGTNCQVYWVIDAVSGKIKGKFETSFGAEYKLDSNLLILNPIDEDFRKSFKESGGSLNTYPCFYSVDTIYLLWDGVKFKTLKKVNACEYLKNCH